jgi:hypothetical protein
VRVDETLGALIDFSSSVVKVALPNYTAYAGFQCERLTLSGAPIPVVVVENRRRKSAEKTRFTPQVWGTG